MTQLTRLWILQRFELISVLLTATMSALQDPVIFSTDAWENIRYGLPDVSDTDVLSAAEATHATEFLDQLP